MSDGSDSMTGTTAEQAQVLAGHGQFLIALPLGERVIMRGHA